VETAFFCGNCGAPREPGSKNFCLRCGAPVSRRKISESLESVAAPPPAAPIVAPSVSAEASDDASAAPAVAASATPVPVVAASATAEPPVAPSTPPAQPASQLATAGVTQRERPLWLVATLTIATLGVYFPFWLGFTWSEMRRTGRALVARPLWHALGSLVPVYGLYRLGLHAAAIRAIDPAGPASRVRRSGFVAAGILAGIIANVANQTAGPAYVIWSMTAAAVLAAMAVEGQRALNAQWRATLPAAARDTSVRPRDGLALAAGLLAVALVVIGNASFGFRVSPLTSSAAAVLTGPQIAAIGRDVTVLIEVSDANGSGVYLGNGLVLSAAHVVLGSGTPTISFREKKVAPAKIVSVDAADDLALLEVSGLDEAGAQGVRWGDATLLRAGDPLFVFGYPITGFTTTSGIVSGLKSLGKTTYVQTDAAVNHGNSGGPFLNQYGQLVAIADFIVTNSTGLNFGVSSSTAKPFSDAPKRIDLTGVSSACQVRETQPESYKAAIALRGKLRAAVREFPPFATKTSSGRWEGFESDLVREIAKDLFGLTDARVDQCIDFVGTTVDTRVSSVAQGRTDVMIAGLPTGDSGLTQVSVTNAYYTPALLAIVKSTSPITTLAALNGRSVCLPAGVSYEPLLRARGVTSAQISTLDSSLACLQAVDAGRFDAFATSDNILANLNIKSRGFRPLDPIVTGHIQPYVIAVPKGHSDFTSYVNGVISDITRAGVWKRLYDTHVRPQLGTDHPGPGEVTQ
jgi:S1-C subfamily serine protease